MDETGYLEYRTHLSVIDVRRRARAVDVTGGDFDVVSPAWDADGRSLVFCADRAPMRDLYPRPRVWRVAADGSAADEAGPQEVAALAGLVEAVSVSPDGRWLALVGSDVEGAPDWDPSSLFLAPARPAEPGVRPVALGPGLDRPIGDWTDTDLHGWSVFRADGPVLVDAAARGRGRGHRGRPLASVRLPLRRWQRAAGGTADAADHGRSHDAWAGRGRRTHGHPWHSGRVGDGTR